MSNWISKRISRSDQLIEVYKNTRIICSERSRNRIVANNKCYVDFATLSYLYLHNRFTELDEQALQQYGYSLSISRTRVKSVLEQVIESRLQSLFCGYYPIIYNSTHMAMLSVLPLLASGELPEFGMPNKTMIILDNGVHHSTKILRDIMSNITKVEYCDFNKIAQLKSIIKAQLSQGLMPILICDSIGSMGDTLPVSELINLVMEYKLFIIFDDAQACSIHGKNGCGYVLKKLNYKINHRIAFVTSFHKGFGAYGSVFLFPKISQKTTVETYGSSYAFSGPMSTIDLSRINQCLDLHFTDEIEYLQNSLWKNTKLFDSLVPDKSLNITYGANELPYRILHFSSENKALQLWKYLEEQGFLTICAVYPTVPKGVSIIRISFNSRHEENDTENLAKIINQYVTYTSKPSSALNNA